MTGAELTLDSAKTSQSYRVVKALEPTQKPKLVSNSPPPLGTKRRELRFFPEIVCPSETSSEPSLKTPVSLGGRVVSVICFTFSSPSPSAKSSDEKLMSAPAIPVLTSLC